MLKLFPFVLVVLFLCSGCQDKVFIQSIEDHRKEYLADFLNGGRSPLDENTVKHVSFFEPNKSYQVKGKFTSIENAPVFKMVTYSGKQLDYRKYGSVVFSVNGENVALYLYKNLRFVNHPEYKDYLFLPFKDDTNDDTTYGGGRYLDFKTSDIQNNEILLDFNKAYNPYCAYSDGYSCPIPPIENHLVIAVKAGEKDYKIH